MVNSRGFGLVELLVGMAILGIVTVALMQILGMQRTQQVQTTISLASIQDQRFLERAIWAQYDQHPGALAACEILPEAPNSTKQISLDSSVTCVAGNGGAVWAEAKRVSDSSCAFYSFSNSVLSLSGCASPETLRDNINSVRDKSEFKISLWANDTDAMICVLEDTARPAGVSGSMLELQLRADCNFTVGALSPVVRVRLPHLAVAFFRRDGGNDGYTRFYYKRD